MEYSKVIWKTAAHDDGYVWYAEVGDDRWETRKIVEFHDGHLEYSDLNTDFAISWIAEAALPTMEEIAEDAEFDPQLISKEAFEVVWGKAVAEGREGRS